MFRSNAMKYLFTALILANIAIGAVSANFGMFTGWLLLFLWFILPRHVTWHNWKELLK